MRMTRHTHNTPHPRHTGPIRTNTTARGARVQGTRDAAYLSTAYGITAHYTSSVPRCVCVAAITAIRPVRSSFVPHAACVRRGVGADAAQPDQRDPCAAARHILGSRAAPHPARHQAQLVMHLLKFVANDRHLLLQVVALLT